MTRIATGKRSKRRWAKTVPSSVALVPLPCGRWRRRTATRASSPARAGRTALPSRPTPYAEKTWPKRGCGSGSAWLIVSRQESARASVESRLSSDADDHPAPGHDVERVDHRPPFGPTPPDREQRAASSASTRIPRAQGLRAIPARRVMRRAALACERALVDPLEPPRDVVPGVALDRERAGARHPSSTRRGSSSSSPATASASAAGSRARTSPRSPASSPRGSPGCPRRPRAGRRRRRG